MKIAKRRTTTTASTLFLMFAIAISLVVLPAANAQPALIMNLPGPEGQLHGPILIHEPNYDIDLNGGPGPGNNISLLIKYPGRTAFTYIWSGITLPFAGGDLDYYDFDFNETGIFELKWAYPPTMSPESNVERLEVLSFIPPDTRKAFAYIGATPNPIGVGQETLIHLGISHQLVSALYGWDGLTVTVTRPDDTIKTLGPFRTDATGGTGTVLVPSMVGNYTLQTHFPEQALEVASAETSEGTIFSAADSEILTLVVQQDPVEFWPGVPLPTEYWTRPIDGQLREWAPIAGQWLTTSPPAGNQFAPGNDDAPETAHVLWTRPLRTGGGLVGGYLGDPYLESLGYQGFEEGDAYEGKFGGGTFFGGGNPLIIAGKLYYEQYAPNDIYKETTCVDLRTGEELWSKVLFDNETITRGQLMYWDTYDYHGVFDYLWVTTGGGFFGPPPAWHAFDPITGDWVYTMTDTPSGDVLYGPKGEMLVYDVNLNGDYIRLWNSTNIPDLYGDKSYGNVNWGAWRPQGKTVDATGTAGVTKEGQPFTAPSTPLGLNGYQWEKAIPADLPGSVWEVFPLDKVIGTTVASGGGFGVTFGTTELVYEVTSWGISLKPGEEGRLLFEKTWQAPNIWADGNMTVDREAISSEDGVFTFYAKEERKYYGFSTETGEFLWVTEEPENYLQLLVARSNAIAYGKLFSTGASGITNAFDVTTGELAWTYKATDPYTEILWANHWWTSILAITDGKIYLGHEEHSPVDPKPRGAPFICLNATTGEEIWRVNGMFRQTGWGGMALVGDSIIATMDTYDQHIYAIGKGPSATTVTAPDIGVPLGKSVLIRGTVTDISPGTEEYALTARFPQGVPAVSDESMSEWMLYVYKQFERPADAVGVDVVLTVLDPNNNVYDVGTTTSDSSGFFSLDFVPDVPGKYTVVATFPGSAGYWGSFSETAIIVEEAPLPPAPEEPIVLPPTETYITAATVAIIIAIAIVGLLLFRKR
jgi:outer membrane protein assembly factor BamB